MYGKLSTSLLAEFIGTFALVFIGVGAGALGFGGLVGVALAYGFVVVAFAYAYGHISGTHINPAVTLGVLAAGKIDAARAFSYVVFQILGGIVGAFALRWVLGGAETGLGVTVPQTLTTPGGVTITITPVIALAVEAILTFFLVNTVMNAGVSGKATPVDGLAVGFTLVFCILMGGPLTGASLNPARTIGPALATGNFSDLWVYLIGPPLGAIAAGLLYKTVFEEERGGVGHPKKK
jgi:MIP family channel proteins